MNLKMVMVLEAAEVSVEPKTLWFFLNDDECKTNYFLPLTNFVTERVKINTADVHIHQPY